MRKLRKNLAIAARFSHDDLQLSRSVLLPGRKTVEVARVFFDKMISEYSPVQKINNLHTVIMQIKQDTESTLGGSKYLSADGKSI